MEKYIESFDGTKIYYIHIKNKNPHTLFFLHGIMANWSVWKKEMEFFENAGYSIISMDLRGHGLSERPNDEEKYHFFNFAKDLNYIIKKEKIKKYSFLGHSLGGAISIIYCTLFNKELPVSMVLVDTAHRYPFKEGHELNMNVFVNHILRYISKHENVKTIFPHMLDKKGELKNFEKDYLTLFGLLYHTPFKCIFKCLDTIHEHSDNHQREVDDVLKKLDMPVLIIASGLDEKIPVTFSKELNLLIKNSRLVVIKDAHHTVPIDKPDEMNGHIFNFFKKYHI